MLRFFVARQRPNLTYEDTVAGVGELYLKNPGGFFFDAVTRQIEHQQQENETVIPAIMIFTTLVFCL